MQTHRLALPVGARPVVDRMIAEDRLGSYRTLAGIEQTLGQMALRLSARLEKKLELHTAIDALAANIEGLSDDFAEFFPLLRAHADKATNTGP